MKWLPGGIREMEWGHLADWKVLVVAVELAVAGTCVVMGWQLVHGHQAVPAARVLSVVSAPVPAPAMLGFPGLPRLSIGGSSTAPRRPGLGDILQRVNRDDARLYRGQWATIQLLGRGTRDYVELHIVPLLLAAARGGSR